MTGADHAGLDILGYRLVVFDLDGTLYRQGPVRRAMLAELLFAGGPPGRVARLRILRRFRHLREEMALHAPRGFNRPLFARLAAETGRDEADLRALVADWMERRPLRHVARACVPGTRALFEGLRGSGRAIAVWSDYPVAAKLAALGLECNHHLCATDPGVDALKPDPAGLLRVMADCGVTPRQTLMVGDRMTHDGAAAAAAGVDFLLRTDRPRGDPGLGAFQVRDFTGLPAEGGARDA